MDVKALVKILGGFCALLGLVLFIPGIFSLLDRDEFFKVFALTGLGSTAFGLACWLPLRGYKAELNNRTAFALVSLMWIISGAIGALPFYFSQSTPSLLDAFFESVSGFTGTGASVIADVEALDRGVLLWRSLTQWLGGMGIVVFFIAILPILGFTSVQLFIAEVAGPKKDRITPRVTETAQRLWILYLILTIALTLFLKMAGMPWFDAVNHAMTTIATGGYSIKNSAIAFYNNPAVDLIISVFMIVGAINFTLLFRLFVLQDGKVWKDTELRWYLLILGGSILALFMSIWGVVYQSGEEAFRHSFFTIASIISSTGFSNHDFIPWPATTHVIIVLLMVMGGMSGSTAGGVKCIRLVAAFKQLQRQLKQVIHPKAVIPVKANEHVIPDAVINGIWGFIFLYFLVFSVGALILTSQGLDLVTASTACFSALSNIGPALGALGPTSNYAGLTDVSKITLTLGMLLGRLEFFTLLVMLTPSFWRR